MKGHKSKGPPKKKEEENTRKLRCRDYQEEVCYAT